MSETPDGKTALRWADVAAMIGVSRRFLERAVASGEFPRPDRTIRRVHLWHRATIEAWLLGERPARSGGRNGR